MFDMGNLPLTLPVHDGHLVHPHPVGQFHLMIVHTFPVIGINAHLPLISHCSRQHGNPTTVPFRGTGFPFIQACQFNLRDWRVPIPAWGTRPALIMVSHSGFGQLPDCFFSGACHGWHIKRTVRKVQRTGSYPPGPSWFREVLL